MNLTQVVPVKVYRWDDPSAPELRRGLANTVSTILKACLVTGYGNKVGAGWTMPFEDNEKGVRVFRPKVGAELDFYAKVSNDTGRLLNIQVLFGMTDIDTGEVKLQCTYPFLYGINGVEKQVKWLLIASERTFWFICEQGYINEDRYSGAWLYCGDTGRNAMGNRAIFLRHTGGNGTSNFGDILTNVSQNIYENTNGRLYEMHNQSVSDNWGRSAYFNGNNRLTELHRTHSMVYLISKNFLYPLVGIYVPSDGGTLENFAKRKIAQGDVINDCICFSMQTRWNFNFCFATDYWVY